jgi:hypothetical protein
MSKSWFLASSFVFGTVVVGAQAAGAPTASDALKLTPVQTGVEYDLAKPSAQEAAACTIKAEKINGATAWVVRSGDGAILRVFLDSNNDNVVDMWSYFHDGLQVYSDIDGDYNGKADQYRWFQTAGSRWAIDKNEDGVVDRWKGISPEEAAEEVVVALATKDAARFSRLLVNKGDLEALGLSKESAQKLSQRVAAAPKTFAELTANKEIAGKAEFTDFGGLRPGVVPAGTSGLSKDLLVYEDAWAMIGVGADHKQLQLGTMVNVGGCWRLVDGPTLGGDQIARGFFYDAEGAAAPAPQVATSEPTAEMQTLLEGIEAIDKQLISAAEGKKAELTSKRADLLEKLATSGATPADAEQWYTQLADMLSAAVQDGTYPDGLARLEKLEEKLKSDKASENLLAHIEFSRMQAAYGQALSDPKSEYAKVQEKWMSDLESFVDAHKSGDQVAEALLQLGMYNEFTGKDKDAQQWYGRLVKDFPKSTRTAKARGALTRLDCVGKPIALRGQALTGDAVDLNRYRGKAVLLHYWSTSAQTCEADHKALVDFYKRFGGDKLAIIGICLDNSREEVAEYLKTHKLPWKQVFEPGGFDSRLANEMGVMTAPLFILTDQKGQGVNSNVQIMDLEDELKKVIPSQVASAK